MSKDFTQPTNLVERAADAGIEAITAHLAHADAKVANLLILLRIDSAPAGEPDAVTAGTEIEDARDLVALLGAHFVEAGRQIGLRIDLVAMGVPPPQG
jgi:hypothetical protein